MSFVARDLNLFFTGKCNLACRYCFVDKRGLNKTLDKKSLKKSIDIFLEFPGKLKTISFIGGEPTLEFPIIKEINDYARQEAKKKDINLVIAVMTNGTLLTREMLDYFKKNKTVLKISIDGNKLSHDKNRPFKAASAGSSFDKIIENIKNIKRDNLELDATMVFTPKDIGHILKNIKFLYSLDFHYIDFYPDLYASWTKDNINEIKKIFREFALFYIKLFEEKKKVFKNAHLDSVVNEIGMGKMEICGKINIGPSGEFYFCEKVFSLKPEKRKQYQVGDIFDGLDTKKSLCLLCQTKKDFYKSSGLKCQTCHIKNFCYCPLGHYLYFAEQKKDIKKSFSNFCCLNRIYFDCFQGIKEKLKFDQRFVELYRYG